MGGTELEVLKALRKKGGEATISAIAASIRMSSNYTGIVCRGLGMDDYVDVFSNGRVRLADKGLSALRKFPPEPEAPAAVSGKAGQMKSAGSTSASVDAEDEEREKPLSPEEKLELWISRGDSAPSG